MKPEFLLDENLRFVPKDHKAFEQYIKSQRTELANITDLEAKVSILGELGVHLRCLDLFDEAESVLIEALHLIKENQMGLRREIQQKIRLAHVIQEKKEFKKSTDLFTDIIAACRNQTEAAPLLDFALQHAGKNYFDQGLYEEALRLFDETFVLRKNKSAPVDQIDSTTAAIRRTKEIISNMLTPSACIEIKNELVLKSVSLSDAPQFLEVIKTNRQHFDSFDFISPQFDSLVDVEGVIQELASYRQAKKGASYGLWQKNKLIGLFTINKIIWHERTADVGFWLIESSTGNGFASRALLSLIINCFEILNLRSVTATTALTNLKSRKILTNIGFTLEKDLPANIQVRGQQINESLFRLFRKKQLKKS